MSILFTQTTAAAVAKAVGAREIFGDASTVIKNFCGIDEISEGSAVCLEDKKYAELILNSAAAVIITAEKMDTGKVQILVEKPKEAFITLLSFLYPDKPVAYTRAPTAVVGKDCSIAAKVKLDAYAVIGDSAAIGEGSIIGAHSVVGDNVSIGRNTVLFPNVTVYADTVIGDNVIIHAGTVIGADGFGYRLEDGRREKIPQRGNVRIGNNVEIGANVTIDRATLGSTVIGNGVKIDNLVQVAHNCRVGENSVLIAQVGIAGSTTIGKSCILAGQVGISDHCVIGDNVIIGAQAGVMSNTKIPPGKFMWGSPVQEMKEEKLTKIYLRKLGSLVRAVEEKLGVKI
ncbi:MAG: UDP-3-O-(3-hydroxymyristoyl)glucosamine N-acyltransferase [Spirochaetes bacterium]|nr:UDP-3-O-(3-hydroxymyristoyl)glucosamine N-acyltransferase [Spirochaetota bacterium]